MHTRCGRAQIITPRLYFLYALSGVMEHIVIAIASDEPHMWRGHRKEAKRGWPGGYRLTRHCEALGGVSPPVRPQRVVPEGGVVLDRCTPWGQLWTPPVTLPHRRHGWRVQRMAVWCPCRRPSMCRPVHCQGRPPRPEGRGFHAPGWLRCGPCGATSFPPRPKGRGFSEDLDDCATR